MLLAQCGCGWSKTDKVAGRAKRSAKFHEKTNPYHITKVTMETYQASPIDKACATELKRLTGAQEIHDRAMEKLEAQQFEIESRKNDLQTAYWALTRLTSKAEADKYLASLQALPW